MVSVMDRRQRKTREAIFNAFIKLMEKKDFQNITVSEIIDCADVGRATFYSHFETKDFLLKEMCEELFCHIFDSVNSGKNNHRHIFDCDAPNSVFLHLFQHLQNNDNNVLKLLSCDNNELFLRYFKDNLVQLIKNQAYLFTNKKAEELPEALYINHIATVFIETLKWWFNNGKKESAETITQYFFMLV